MRIYLELEARQAPYRQCTTEKRERLNFLEDNPFYTNRFVFYVGTRCRPSWLKEPTGELLLDWHTVRKLEKCHMREQLRRAGCRGPKTVGIDEIAIRYGHHHRIVVSDLLSGRATWFCGTDRSETSMGEFYRFLRESKAKRVRLALMDMWTALRNSTSGSAPRAAILFGNFHVIHHLDDVLDQIGTSEYRQLVRHNSSCIK
jgi:transposase